jgi:hypothetical protein
MVNLLGSRAHSDRSAVPLRPDALALLAVRLDPARRWCGLRPADLALSDRLRTRELAPDLEEDPSLAALEAAVLELVEARERLLLQIEWASGAPRPEPGRLLVCEVNMGLGDGLSEAHSRGFFDAADLPPWDTWLIAYGKTRKSEPGEPLESLIAWVPESLVGYARAGIAAHRSGSLQFVDEGANGLAEQLAALGPR